MTDKPKLFDVQTVHNDYHALGSMGGPHGMRPEWLYYCNGPGGPGPHGILLDVQMYFDTREAAERAIPMLEQAYYAGRRSKMNEIRKALEI